MKSRTRKNKTRVLIAFGKGIASTLALELAMLFSHGGMEVRAALIDNGSEWVSEAPLKQLCGHSALSVAHKPGWFYAGLTFDAGLVIGPSTLTQQQLLVGLTADPVIDFIRSSCQHLTILQNRQQLPADQLQTGSRISFIELPAQAMKLGQFYQKIFADVTARIAACALLKNSKAAISYQVPQALKSFADPFPAWLQRFKSALEKVNISPVEADQAADVFISAYDGPGIDSEGRLQFNEPAATHQPQARLNLSFIAADTPEAQTGADSSHILIKRLPNCLVVYDGHGSRMLPDVSGQCCYDRLADYLAVNLGRELKKTGKTESA